MARRDASPELDAVRGPRLGGTAFPWFDRESYPRILEVMMDHDLLPGTYDRWLNQAQTVLEKARREGLKPIRAHIDPDDFLAWCEDNDSHPDSAARLAYAEYVARIALLRGDSD